LPKSEKKYSVVISKASKRYVTETEQVSALSSISLRIEEGSITALVGPSGSGKTTLLNIIAALDFPTSGSVTVHGLEASSLGASELQKFRNEVVGVVFQQFFLIDHLTALENVMTPLLPRNLKPENKRAQALEALEKVGLGNKAQRYPSELSGGELQRVAIARGIVGDPRVILADEPTGNLDLKRGLDIVDLLASESGVRGKTVVIATHDTRILDHVAGVAYLDDGVLTKIEGQSITSQ
jgi:putative ABC transport system ATP-binding protein